MRGWILQFLKKQSKILLAHFAVLIQIITKSKKNDDAYINIDALYH